MRTRTVAVTTVTEARAVKEAFETSESYYQRAIEDPDIIEATSMDLAREHFLLGNYLRKHEKRVHKDQQPHKCKACGKKFACSDTLQVHENIHST